MLIICPYLQLEENIRTIALSGEWIKLVDDLLVEPSVIQGPACTVGTAQKRAPYSKRGRKQNAIHEVIDDECNDKSFVWWQGGKLSKIIFQRAILARSLVKKAARQGKFAYGFPSCKTRGFFRLCYLWLRASFNFIVLIYKLCGKGWDVC